MFYKNKHFFLNHFPNQKIKAVLLKMDCKINYYKLKVLYIKNIHMINFVW